MTDTTAQAPRDTFRPDIEGMRGLAVLVVVLFHAGLAGVVGGFIGVDVFFVISGFLITGLLVREHERTGGIVFIQFYARRARRLLPAAVVVLVSTLVVGLYLVNPLDRASVGLDGAASALSIGNIRFALAEGDYFSSVANPSPFLHFWSLAVEEQFYLVWPALILLVGRGMHARRQIIAALLAITGLSFVLNVVITDAAANWAFYSLPTRAWELGLGALLAVGAGTLARIPGRVVGVAGWAGLAMIVAAAFVLDSSLPYPGIAALVPAVGAALLIAGGERSFGPGWLLATGPMRFLGKISYSLYLVHWPILVLAPLAIGAELDDLTRAALATLAVAVAYVSWALIETPFRTSLPSLALRPGRTVSLGLASIVAVVTLAAGPSVGLTPFGSVTASDTTSSVTPDASEEPWPSEAWPDDSPAPSLAASPSVRPGHSAKPSATPKPSAKPRPTAPPNNDVAAHGALPGNVRPALGMARADEDRLRNDGCLAFEGESDPRRCVYGNPNGSFTVALVGDSHAAQWFPAVERLARHKGWRLLPFVKVACPFIDMPVSNTSLKREYRECAAFNQAVVARLNAVKPNLTLVSMSRIAIHPLSAQEDTVAAKGAAVGRMISRIHGRVALIDDTPWAGYDVPGCLASHVGNIDACAIPRWTAFVDHLGSLEAVAAQASGAGLINLTSRICIDSPCSVVVNGMIVYRDHSHMSATFSRSLAPALGWKIGRLLAKS